MNAKFQRIARRDKKAFFSYQCKKIKEKYARLNAKFQRIARRNKEAFLSDQCKEIEEQ